MKEKNFIIIFLLVAVVVFGGGMISSCSSRDDNKPNVIFLLLDAARPDRFGCYGYDRNTSPVIDDLAAEGALFLNHFANGTYTLASVPTYFYSRYFVKSLFPADRRIPLQNTDDLFRKLDDEAISIASVFKSNGYRTALFSAHPWFVKLYELVRDYDDFYRVSGERSGYGSAEKTFARMAAWIKEEGEGREPFFIYAHLMDTHFPHERNAASESYIRPETDSPARFDWRGFPLSQKIGPGGLAWLPEDFPEEDLHYLNAIYDGDIKYTDTQLGSFIRFLKEKGLFDNTLLVITSDHGEHLGEHNLTEHEGPPWDSVISIPLIMRLPGKIDPGTRIGALTENVDILPTLIDLLDLTIPKGKEFDGKNALSGAEAETEEYVLTTDSIRSTRYKYMVDRVSGLEFLYDLRGDPGEENNLIKTDYSQAAKLKEKMDHLLEASLSRYEQAVNRNTPELPFAISADFFELSSASPIDIIKEHNYPSGQSKILSRAQKTPQWTHNKSPGRYYILGFNQPGLSPLSIRVPLPNGRYRVMVACSAGEMVQGYPMSIFRMSLGRDNPAESVLVDTSKDRKKGQFDLGELLVEEEEFRAFLYPMEEPSWSSLLYFGFEPILSSAADDDLVGKKGTERLEQLKSLGYVQ